jgi:hypothetical protein
MAGGVVEVAELMEHKRGGECVQSVFYITMDYHNESHLHF